MAVDIFLAFYRSQYYFKIVELSLFKSYEHVNCVIYIIRNLTRERTLECHTIPRWRVI